MRRLIVIFLFTQVFIHSSAQFKLFQGRENLVDFDAQEFSWGYFLGVNYFDFKVHPNNNGLTGNNLFTVYSRPGMGFTAGLMGRWRLNEILDFRMEPGIHFVQRELVFSHVKDYIGTTTPGGYLIKESDTIRSIKSTYVDIPVFLNLHGERWGNTRPYIQAGVGWAFNLQSNEKKADDNLQEVFRLKTHNFNWQFEAGVEIYFKRFKLTPSLKGIFFFNNELVVDNPDTPPLWAGSLTSISTRALVFSLKFE